MMQLLQPSQLVGAYMAHSVLQAVLQQAVLV
jgi:hypothetical protein